MTAADPARGSAPETGGCLWTVEEDGLVVICGRDPVMLLIVVGGRDHIQLCQAHADEVGRLPNVATADDKTLVMRWA